MRKCPLSCPYFAPAFQRRSKAVPANPGALFRPRVYMTFGILLTSTVVGTAEAMLAEDLVQSRKAVASKEIGTFQAQQIKLGEATAALNAVQAQIRAEALKFKRSPLPTSSRTSYAIEISQQRCICGRARILGNRRILIWQALAQFCLSEIGKSLSQRGTSRKAFTSIPPSTGALASTSR